MNKRRVLPKSLRVPPRIRNKVAREDAKRILDAEWNAYKTVEWHVARTRYPERTWNMLAQELSGLGGMIVFSADAMMQQYGGAFPYNQRARQRGWNQPQ